MGVINVRVFKRMDTGFYVARWVDPRTGRDRQKSAQTKIKRDAERFAAKLEKELQEGTYFEEKFISWKNARDRYETEVLPGLASKSGEKMKTMFNLVEAVINPGRLAQVDESAIAKITTDMRNRGRTESTVKSNLSSLRTFLNWAEEQKLIPIAPKVRMPVRAKTSKIMKGRPITGEEFERILSKVPDVVGNDRSASWRFLLNGLWLCGLRLGEALELWWDRDDMLSVDFSGRFPMLRIRAESEKGNQDRLLPMTPDFAEFLQSVPEEERTGRIFQPQAERVYGDRLRMDTVSSIICEIGKKAAVVVHTESKTGKVKFASAHDLRRSFGERWSLKVMPAILQQLMRHSSISTTMNFYVGRNAEKAAAVLWEAKSSDVFRDGKQNRVNSKSSSSSQPQADDEVKKYTRRDSNPRPTV
jgi:integrase